MGQRLNIEIWNNGEVLANAYYHWSAYTESAAKITGQILKNISDNCEFHTMYAVKLLEKTGAGINEYEKERIIKEGHFDSKEFNDCIDRNEGIIAITKDGINETRFWEEGRVTIYLDEKRVDFDVFFRERTYVWEREQEEYGKNIRLEDIPRVNVNFSDIKFEKFDELFDIISFISDEGYSFVSEVKPGIVLTVIA